jgi:hypothetical protein
MSGDGGRFLGLVFLPGEQAIVRVIDAPYALAARRSPPLTCTGTPTASTPTPSSSGNGGGGSPLGGGEEPRVMEAAALLSPAVATYGPPVTPAKQPTTRAE